MSSGRRQFLRTSALGGMALATAPWSKLKLRGANDKINLGLIGANGMGFNNLRSFLKHTNCQCLGIADIDENVYHRRAAELKQAGHQAPKYYADYRQLLENNDIDAVIIGTPDHWHCLQLVHALEAGKAVYLEKPIGNSIAEIDLMLRALKRYPRLVQVGQWQRSQPHFVDAIAYVHSGALGRIRTTKAWAYIDWKGAVPKVPNSAVPAGVNYAQWLGPAPDRPFNQNRFHFTWRWYWEYAGGVMTDWGVHLIDYILYGMKVSVPKSILALGGKMAYPDDDMVTPDTLHTVYDFGDFTLLWEHTIGIGNGYYGKGQGLSFVGDNGTLVLTRGGWEVIPEKNKLEKITVTKKAEDNGLDLHVANFITCLQQNTPEQLHAPLQVGRDVALVAQMGNLAFRTGEKINWDDTKKTFDSPAANQLMVPEYHHGLQIPQY